MNQNVINMTQSEIKHKLIKMKKKSKLIPFFSTIYTPWKDGKGYYNKN